MSATNRAQVINKLFKVAKKHYSAPASTSSRGVLENMLYACCLENSIDEAADEAFAKLEQQFYDWNEVRVTTNSELAESMKSLVDPEAAATTLKKTLHGVFETYYKFDLDFLKKENLRKTVQQFAKFKGTSGFVVSYTAQVALGGHYIPLDKAMLNLMYVVGAISEDEARKGKVPGLERTIAKTKGVEFASVVHQLAAAYHKSPFGKEVRDVILSVAADAKDRFPKRGGRKKDESNTAAEPKEAESTAKAEKTTSEKKAAVKKEEPAKKTAKKKPSEQPVKKGAKTSKSTKKATTKKSTPKVTEKAPARKAAKKSTTKKAATKKAPAKKATAKKVTPKKSAAKKTATAKKAASTKKTTPKKKTSTSRSSKRKPR